MKVGVIGTGFGARTVAPAFKAADVDVIEIASPHDNDAVKRLCTQSDADLISIHSPPFMHRQHIEWAAGAGKHILCDKPFGASVAESEACVEIAKRAGVLNFLNVEFRFIPMRVKMRDLVKSGAIGRIEHIYWKQHGVGARAPMRRWGWLFDNTRGGGWVGAWSSHGVDFLHWIAGDIGQVGGMRRQVIAQRVDRDGSTKPCTTEDGLVATLEVAGGATALFDTTFCARVGTPLEIGVLGSEGNVIDYADKRLVLMREGKSEVVSEAEVHGDHHNMPMENYAKEIKKAVAAKSAGDLPTFVDALKMARVLERLWKLPMIKTTG